MADKNILILGNKHYHNFKLDNIIDSFDVIYRFNLACPGKNSGTKFGILAMCGHIYENFIARPMNKKRTISTYEHDYDTSFLSNWYDFFQENKGNFDKIYHEAEKPFGDWNRVLEEYGSPHRFSRLLSTGYSVILRNLLEGNDKIYISGFTLCPEELRESIGDADGRALERSQGKSCHNFSEESRILAWLHNNKKIDASLCMLEDTEELSLKSNEYGTEPSEFILGLLNKEYEA